MGKLVEHLMPCAICGAVPKINDIYDRDPEKAEHCYKLFCSENGVHNRTGEWFANKYKACQDWNRRQQALEEKEKTFGDKLKPCPFCGRKMQFFKFSFKGRDGKKHRRMYFIHKDYNPYEDGYCILDELCTQFSIGAGDADIEKGYIGEYATKWNKRACNDEDAMHEIKQTLLGTIQPLERTVELLEQRNKELEQENEKQKQIIKRTSQWRVNKDIKSPFANISGLCCVHCDHKDEYIIELEEENEKLKKLLKLVTRDAEQLFRECVDVSQEIGDECIGREYCDECYCDDYDECNVHCKWRYQDTVEKLLGEVK